MLQVEACIYGNGHNIMGFLKKHELLMTLLLLEEKNLPNDED